MSMPMPMQGPTLEQKFAMFIGSLTPDEQRQVAPLMQIFSQTVAGPQQGQDTAPPPMPPPGATPAPPATPPPSAVPGGPPLPPPDPVAMSIGRQSY